MDVFVARQPILDAEQRVYGYELLFRSGLESAFRHPDPTQASSRVIADSYFLLGIEALTAGKRAFINLTRELLLDGSALLLPKDTTVVEILETVPPDAEVVAACHALKRAGYVLALDDFAERDPRNRLVPLADIVKIDVLATGPAGRRRLVNRFRRPGLAFLAEKVETPQEFRATQRAGFTYFQGYFFCRPVIVSGTDVPGVALHYLQILAELHRPEPSFVELENIIKRDVALSYKLLHTVNSAFFARRRPIESLRQALMQLGEKMVRTWASLLALATIGRDKPPALVTQAVIRGKFCELLAAQAGARPDDAFLTGMFSLIDAIVGRPLAEILADLPLGEPIKAALLGTEKSLRAMCDLAVAQEHGDWDAVTVRAAALGIPEASVPALYHEAVVWGHASYHGVTRE